MSFGKPCIIGSILAIRESTSVVDPLLFFKIQYVKFLDKWPKYHSNEWYSHALPLCIDMLFYSVLRPWDLLPGWNNVMRNLVLWDM